MSDTQEKCKCKNEMKLILDDNTDIYYCENCGRLLLKWKLYPWKDAYRKDNKIIKKWYAHNQLKKINKDYKL